MNPVVTAILQHARAGAADIADLRARRRMYLELVNAFVAEGNALGDELAILERRRRDALAAADELKRNERANKRRIA